VLICPDCYPTALDELGRCSRCDGVRLVRRLDQVECLNCRLIRDAEAPGEDHDAAVPAPRAADPASGDPALAAEVASALARILGGQ
jgi:hypothetical protein